MSVPSSSLSNFAVSGATSLEDEDQDWETANREFEKRLDPEIRSKLERYKSEPKEARVRTPALDRRDRSCMSSLNSRLWTILAGTSAQDIGGHIASILSAWEQSEDEGISLEEHSRLADEMQLMNRQAQSLGAPELYDAEIIAHHRQKSLNLSVGTAQTNAELDTNPEGKGSEGAATDEK
ncbi:hypothetical protein I302_107875 [Kwoniella bestiolae CBS 10118]|uniref:Uncharacterized protein n=1 Tax=Kwoniella bestiolae CBS 10118 TaxID=1296100 RepID=A0A1B9FXB3_9TREE|nr:hypothetical protein I302_06383 [Kwoniella bestiolae CBS 10118]OCF23402.1 hypothetical protein I302_06383 [Kwoniella bestiolae CBS 10118]